MVKLFNIERNDNICAVTISIFGLSMSFRNYKKYAKKLRETLQRVKTSKKKYAQRNKKLLETNDRYLQLITNLKDKINNCKIDDFHMPSGINSEYGSYKEFFLQNNMLEKIQALKEGLDEKSQNVIDNDLHKMLHLPDRKYREFFRINLNDFAQYIQADYEKLGAEICQQELDKWKQQYPLCEDKYDIEVLYSHHGLKKASSKVIEYIKNKDFIDGGAYIGDSALVLMGYSPKKVYSFEMSQKNCEKYIKTMELNNINSENYELIPYGISDSIAEISIDDSGKNNTSLGHGGDNKVKVTDIDSYVFENNLNVGFIKTDLEGFGLPALNGMVKTIQTFRPVLSMAIYHCPEEFFEIKPRLEEITKDIGYTIRIERDYPLFHGISGTVIFAYPNEMEE